jgi:hypothetical protein
MERDEHLSMELRQADVPAPAADLQDRVWRRIDENRRRRAGQRTVIGLTLGSLAGAVLVVLGIIIGQAFTPVVPPTQPLLPGRPDLAELKPLTDRPPVDPLRIVRSQQDETLAVLEQWARGE